MSDISHTAPTSEVETAVSQINALRQVTLDTGCVTRRTQSILLSKLRPDVLTAVAAILAAQPEVPRG